MSKFFATFSIICFTALSCSKDCGCEQPPETCANKAIDEFIKRSDALAVYQYTLNGEKGFLLDAGERLYDGTIALINFDCDTLCLVGGLLPSQCSLELKEEVVLWQK